MKWLLMILGRLIQSTQMWNFDIWEFKHPI